MKKFKVRVMGFILLFSLLIQAAMPMSVYATEVEGGRSSDNSLSSLSLSSGTLSPEFYYSTTKYTATVPYDITAVEVNAETSNGKAHIESITGNNDLQPGENTIKITVIAENEAKAVYTITVTREAALVGANTDMPQDSGATEGNTDENGQTVTEAEILGYEQQLFDLASENQKLRDEYETLEEEYKAEKASSRRTTAILCFVIIVLVIAMINLFLFSKRKNEEDSDYDFENEEGDDEIYEEDDEEDKFTETKKSFSPIQDDIEIIDFDEF